MATVIVGGPGYKPSLTELADAFGRLRVKRPNLTLGYLLKNYKRLTSEGVKLSKWKRLTKQQ